MSSSVRYPVPRSNGSGSLTQIITPPTAAAAGDATVTAVPAAATGAAPAGIPTASAGTADFSTYPNGALTAPWAAWNDASRPSVVSGAIPTVSGLPDAVYQVTMPSADSQNDLVFNAAVSSNSGNASNAGVGVRLAGAAGYALEMRDAGSAMRGLLYRGFNTGTLLATGAASFAGVEAIRITTLGSTIKGWFRISGVWTEVVTATDGTYASAGAPGFWFGASGTPGSTTVTSMTWGVATAGGDATVSAVTALAAGSASVAVVTAGSTVTAVVADAVGSAPPANQIISSVVNAPAVVALGSAPAATVGAGGDATVTAVPATAAGSAPVGTLSAGSTVTAVVADATGAAPVAAVTAGATVTAVPALAVGQALRPTISPAPPGGAGTAAIAVTFAEDSA